MKKTLLFLCLIASVAFSLKSVAQELVTSGNMESASAWTVYNVLDNADEPEYTFNFTGDVPAAGTGGCLRISGGLNPMGSNAQIDSWCYQTVTLTPGTTYLLTGAFKDFGSEPVFNFWCEIGFGPYNPSDSANAGVEYLMGINTWDGCGADLDGTFQEDYCKYTGPYYRVPESSSADTTLYLIIETGAWYNMSDAHYWDVLIDEISLMDSASAPSVIGSGIAVDPFSLTSYPNPFSGITMIEYTLKERSEVNLTVYNILGDEVFSMHESMKTEGTYRLPFDSGELSAGVYLCTLRAGNSLGTFRLVKQ